MKEAGFQPADLSVDHPSRFSVVESLIYLVDPDFPAITPASFVSGQMPAGVLRLRYLRVAEVGSRWSGWSSVVPGGRPTGLAGTSSWSPDEPEAPALRAVRLYLNEGHAIVRAAVTANPPEPHQQVIRDAIEFDVARSLILGALRADPEAWDQAAGEPGSIASVVNRLLRVVFPTETLEGLRNRYSTTPQRLEVKIQDGLRLFRDLPVP